MANKTKNKFDSFEITHFYDIKFKGNIKNISDYSIDFVLRLDEKGKGNILDEAFKSNSPKKIDVIELVKNGDVNAKLIFQLEGKIQNTTKSGFFTKGKTATVIELKNTSQGIVLSSNKYTSYQVGLQNKDERVFYKQKSSINPKVNGYVISIKDKSIKKDGLLLLPKDWNVETVYQIKEKSRIILNYKEHETIEEANIASISTNEKSKITYQPNLLYTGILLTIGVWFAKNKEWKIPFLDDYESAYIITLGTIGLGAAQWSSKKGNSYFALSIILLTIGGLGWWQSWEFPLIGSHEYLIYSGVVLGLFGLAPSILGIPLLLSAAILLFFSMREAINVGFNTVPYINWALIIALFLTGRWLVKKHDKLNKEGRFRK